MSMIRKINYIFSRKQKIRLVEVFFLILIGTALETIGVAALLPFVNAIMYPEKFMRNKYVQWISDLLQLQSVTQLISVLALILMAIYIVKNLFSIFMYDVQYRFVYNNQRRLAHRLMDCYLRQPYAFHLNHNSAELIHNMTSDVDMFFSTTLQCLMVVTDACICVTMVIVLLITDKTITLSLIIMILLFMLCFLKGYKKKVKKMGEDRRKYAIRNTKCIQQAFGGIKEVKILNREKYFSTLYEQQYCKYVQARRRAATYSMVPKPFLEMISVVSLLAVVSIKISRGVDTEYFIPTLTVFAGAVVKIMPSCSKIAAGMSSIIFGKSSIDAVYNDLKSIEKFENQDIFKTDIDDEICFKSCIRLDKLRFRYSDTEKWVLDRVDLTIPKNRSVAFIGPSGAGKTTLADVLLGVLEYEEGNIFIDDVNMQTALKSWQKKIGYIPQTIFLTDDTIRRNIAFAIPDKEINDEKVWKALEEAQLKEFIGSLPKGIDTVIGERGVRISGGQRQRIGIARALYNNPEVLVLDEATSALDNETEKAVMDAIDALNGKKTLIIIAHRLSTIENCDIVFEIKDGQVCKI